jgi:predicted transcriptional regulator
MQVNTRQATALSLASTAKANGQSGFQAALAAAQQAIGQTSQTGASAKTSAQASSVAPKTAAQELADYMAKTPMQHMREAILEELGLSEEALAALSPEQRAAVEVTIAEKVRERLLAQDGGTTVVDGLAPAAPGRVAVDQW